MISDRGPCCMPAVHYTLHTCVRLCDYCTAVCSNYVALIESSLNWMSPVIPRCWRSRHLRFDLVPPNGTHTHTQDTIVDAYTIRVLFPPPTGNEFHNHNLSNIPHNCIALHCFGLYIWTCICSVLLPVFWVAALLLLALRSAAGPSLVSQGHRFLNSKLLFGLLAAGPSSN